MKNIMYALVACLLIAGVFYYYNVNKTPEVMEPEQQVMVEEPMEIEELSDEVEILVGYMDISPMEAKEMLDMDSTIVIVDVSSKYAEGHLPGAVNHYVEDGSLDTAIPTLDLEATYLVYCHTDAASMEGAQKLIDAGFMNVFRLEGNYSAWVDAGYDVEM